MDILNYFKFLIYTLQFLKCHTFDVDKYNFRAGSN